jgi:hypothetical protein
MMVASSCIAPPHIARDVSVMVDNNLLFGHSILSTTYERMMDSMLFEALLMNQRHDMEGYSSTPPSTIQSRVSPIITLPRKTS